MKQPALTAALLLYGLLAGAPAASPAATPAPTADVHPAPAPLGGDFPPPDGAVPLSTLPETARERLETSLKAAPGVPVATFVPQKQSGGAAPPTEVFAARNLTPEAGVRLSAEQFEVIGRQLALQTDPDLKPHQPPKALDRIRAFLGNPAQTQSILEVDVSNAGGVRLAAGQGSIRLLRLDRLPGAAPLVLTAAQYLFYGDGKVLLLSHSLPYESAQSLDAARGPLEAWAKRVQTSGYPL